MGRRSWHRTSEHAASPASSSQAWKTHHAEGFSFVEILKIRVWAFINGRTAGRVKGERLAYIGFLVCGAATLWNLGYRGFVRQPGVIMLVMPTLLIALRRSRS